MVGKKQRRPRPARVRYIRHHTSRCN